MRTEAVSTEEARTAIRAKSPTELSADLHGLVTDAAPSPSPSHLHRALTNLPIDFILTTNFDTLLEQAIASSGRRVTPAISAWDLADSQRDSASDITILKLHGDLNSAVFLDRESPDLVLTLPERTRILDSLAPRIHKCTLLFVGFSARDRSLADLATWLSSSSTARPSSKILITFEGKDDARDRRKLNTPTKHTTAIDYIIHSTPTETAEMLRDIARSSRGSDKGLPGSLPRSLVSYRNHLLGSYRYTWTVDPLKNLDVTLASHRCFTSAQLQPHRLSYSEDLRDWITERREAKLTEPLAALRSCHPGRRIAVVGSAGSGKTTFLRHLAQSLASQPDASEAFPIIVDAASVTGSTSTGDVDILGAASTSSGIPGTGQALARLRHSTKIIALIDGLDEIPRGQIGSINTALRKLQNDSHDLIIVVACRPSGYEDFLSSEFDSFVHVEPFNDGDVARFLRGWYQGNDEAVRLHRSIRNHKMLSELAKSPLFLGILAHGWSQRRTRTLGVWELYSSAIDLLVGNWDYHRGIFRDEQYARSIKLHALRIAAVAQMRGTGGAASELVGDWEAQLGLSARECYDLMDELIATTGILRLRTTTNWCFSHISFAWYFAAAWLIDANPIDAANELAGEDGRLWHPPLSLALSSMSENAGEHFCQQLIKAGAITQSDKTECIGASLSHRGVFAYRQPDKQPDA